MIVKHTEEMMARALCCQHHLSAGCMGIHVLSISGREWPGYLKQARQLLALYEDHEKMILAGDCRPEDIARCEDNKLNLKKLWDL
jgi:hypothetical protein